jgi:DNA-binding transcriptional regulator YiaG
MPAASLADDIALTSRVLVGMARNPGMSPAQVRMAGQVDVGELAKAAGASPEQVRSWEAGLSRPPPHQGLVWLSSLYDLADWRARGAAGEASGE